MSAQVSLFGDDEQLPEELKAAGKNQALPKEKKPGDSIEKIMQGWAGDKQYYAIGEVAALFSANTSHIRFWTKEFDLKVRTTAKGDRLYTPVQVRELAIIYGLVKEKGYTIAGAKAKLKSDKKATVQAADLKQSLLQLRNKLISLRNQLT
jgi:DNA-binding transcriptional MerR regulator